MPEPVIAAFIAGVLAMGYAVGGFFFLRFWSRTRDSLFMVFAFAFWLMAANSALPILLGIPREDQSGVYLLRLGAFVLIIAAILGKNLSRRRS